jgi:hypothetical protein
MCVRQVRTVGASLRSIMNSKEFARGFDDARKGIPFDWTAGLERDTFNGQWNYERGRLFAHIAPLSMSLRIGGKLNPKAIALCNAAFARKLVI